MGIHVGNKKRRIGLYLGILLVIATIVRIIIFNEVYQIDSNNVIDGDSTRYERPARSLIDNGNFYDYEPKDLNKTEVLRSPPGYPLFIAGVYSIFGEARYAVIIAQILVSIFSVWLIYLIAATLWSKKVGLIAAALLVFEPLQMYYSQVMMSELLLIPTLLLFVLFSLHMMTNEKQRYKYALLMGLALAAGTMVRPINYYMIIPVIVGLSAFKSLIGFKPKELVSVLMLIVIPYTLIIGGWHMRNGDLTGAYVFTDNEGALLLPFKASAVLAHKSGRTAEEEFADVRKTLPDHYSSLSEKLAYEREKGFEIIGANKYDYLMLSLKNLPQILLTPGWDELKTFGGKSRGSVETPQGITELSWVQQIELKVGYKLWYFVLMGALGGYLLVIYGFFIYGVINSWSTASQYVAFHLLVLGLILFYIGMSSGNSFSYSRLRAPLMPFFVLYAGHGLSLLWDAIRSNAYVKASILKRFSQKVHYS